MWFSWGNRDYRGVTSSRSFSFFTYVDKDPFHAQDPFICPQNQVLPAHPSPPTPDAALWRRNFILLAHTRCCPLQQLLSLNLPTPSLLPQVSLTDAQAQATPHHLLDPDLIPPPSGSFPSLPQHGGSGTRRPREALLGRRSRCPGVWGPQAESHLEGCIFSHHV